MPKGKRYLLQIWPDSPSSSTRRCPSGTTHWPRQKCEIIFAQPLSRAMKWVHLSPIREACTQNLGPDSFKDQIVGDFNPSLYF